jgi:hypothetical protein
MFSFSTPNGHHARFALIDTHNMGENQSPLE